LFRERLDWWNTLSLSSYRRLGWWWGWFCHLIFFRLLLIVIILLWMVWYVVLLFFRLGVLDLDTELLHLLNEFAFLTNELSFSGLKCLPLGIDVLQFRLSTFPVCSPFRY
jgi:hypothetical protein